MRSDAEEESIAEEEIASAQGGAAAGGGHGLATRIDELRSELHHILGPEVLDNAYRRLRAMAEGEDDVVDQEVRLILGCPPPPLPFLLVDCSSQQCADCAASKTRPAFTRSKSSSCAKIWSRASDLWSAAQCSAPIPPAFAWSLPQRKAGSRSPRTR